MRKENIRLERKQVWGTIVILLIMGMLLLAFSIQPAESKKRPRLLLETDKNIYVLGENVTIVLTNIGTKTVQIGGYPAWHIYTYPEEESVYPAVYAFLAWSLDPGENDTFIWNQYNEFTKAPAEVGMYVVRDIQGWGLSTYFQIVPGEQWIPHVPNPDEVELSYWSVQETAYVNVTLTSSPCTEIDWGTVSRRGSRELWADSQIWLYQGVCILTVETFEHTYELGELKYGKTYTFTFKAWGFPIESITFKHLPPQAHVH